jgi:hypothetical protein
VELHAGRIFAPDEGVRFVAWDVLVERAEQAA